MKDPNHVIGHLYSRHRPSKAIILHNKYNFNNVRNDNRRNTKYTLAIRRDRRAPSIIVNFATQQQNNNKFLE
jgi:hypothetical protein